jgi:hypothetical protein
LTRSNVLRQAQDLTTPSFESRLKRDLVGRRIAVPALLQPFGMLGGRAHPLFIGEKLAEEHAGEGVLPIGRHFAQSFDDLLKRGCHTLYCSIDIHDTLTRQNRRKSRF